MKQSKFEHEQLIREYVKRVLISEEGGGDYGLGVGGYSPSSVKNVFGPALSDIFKAGAALVSKTAAGIKRLISLGFEGMVELLTGGILEAEYDKINSTYQSEISSIESKYADAIGRSWNVLKDSAAPLAMLYSPSLYLTSKVIADNPRLAANVATVFALTGSPLLGGTLSAATSAKGVALGLVGRKYTQESRIRLFKESEENIENQEIKNVAAQVKKAYDNMLKSSTGMLEAITKTLLSNESKQKLSNEQILELKSLLEQQIKSLTNEKKSIVDGLTGQKIPSSVISQDPLVNNLELLIKRYDDALSMLPGSQNKTEK
jgi:hypothetical protein